jgi:hypothetical protein
MRQRLCLVNTFKIKYMKSMETCFTAVSKITIIICAWEVKLNGFSHPTRMWRALLKLLMLPHYLLMLRGLSEVELFQHMCISCVKQI